jgi:hypothetical protein
MLTLNPINQTRRHITGNCHLIQLLLLLERMNDSKGPKQITKALGNTRNAYGMKTDFLAEVRRKYASFYQKDLFQPDKKHLNELTDFDSIFLG